MLCLFAHFHISQDAIKTEAKLSSSSESSVDLSSSEIVHTPTGNGLLLELGLKTGFRILLDFVVVIPIKLVVYRN